MRNFAKLWKHPSAKIGLCMYAAIWLFTILTSFVMPLDTYAHDPLLADLPPSQSYLDVPSSLASKPVSTIVSGITYSLALCEDGHIEAWGDLPFSLTELDKIPIHKLASGAKHIVVSDMDSTIYEFGEVPAQYKKLSNETMTFMKTDGIREVYATDTFSACLTNHGYFYFWGMTSALAVNEIPADHQGHIAKAVVHPYHILYLLDDGTMHLLGREDRLTTSMPEEIANGSLKITAIAMNYDSILVVDEHQSLHTWGDTTYDLPTESKAIQNIVSGRKNYYILYDDETMITLGEDRKSFKNINEIYANYFQAYALNDEKIIALGHKGFLLGSDAYGRNILTRLAHGGFATLLIGLPACLLSLFLAVLFGLSSGYYGGRLDQIFLRISDCISSIPFLPIVITLSAFLMPYVEGYTRIIIVMLLYGCVSWTSLARLIRSKVMSEKEKDYILYEEAIGASDSRILWKHIFPSTFSLIAADITSLYASAMLMEAGLSFLGFGVPPILPSWGNMLQAAQSIHVIDELWWQWFFPALFIFLTILSIHLITEAMRKDLNPKE